MNNYSPGVRLVWRLAVHESAMLHSSLIETDHFLLAMSKIAETPNIDEADVPAEIASKLVEISNEAFKINTAFTLLNIPTRKFRDQLRGALAVQMQSDFKPPAIYHRSEECKKVFQIAKTQDKRELEVQLSHLFLALMRHASKNAQAVLKYHGLKNDELADLLDKQIKQNNLARVRIKPELN